MIILSFVRFAVLASCLHLASAAPASNQATLPLHKRIQSSGNGNVTPTFNNASCTNSPQSRGCWSDGYDINTDSSISWPITGRTRPYTLEVMNTTMAPDGHERLVFAVNGQFPGPTIEADWGDELSITVKNSLQHNGTSIHWHGMSLPGANNMDGTNGITECPLAPGDSRTYNFIASQHGTSWYHSHHSAQYGDGVQGPIVINGPATADYDIDLGPMTISDWYYLTATQIDYIMAPRDVLPLTANNSLINGTMKSPDGSSGSYAYTKLQPGKTHRLRLINTAVDNHFKVQLDGHQMTIIAADFVAVEPQVVDWLFIGIGQRYDVLITANQTIDNYWFRAEVQTECGENFNNYNIKSIFSYEGAGTEEPSTQGTTYTPSCDDQAGLVPYVKKDVPSADFTAQAEELEVLLSYGTKATYSENGSSVVQWSFDDNLIHVDWEKPTLDYVFNGESNWTAEQNIIELPAANKFTFWIIQAFLGDIGTAPHPMHLHGHDFYVLGSGPGNFTDPSSLTFSNPPRRDVAMMPANGWLVLAFETINPGVWLLHCHIAWHVSEGFALQFLERGTEIPGLFTLDDEFERTCKNWDRYYDSAVYTQFESGL